LSIEYSNAYNKPTYDEHTLIKAADDYFIEKLNKKDSKSMEIDSITSWYYVKKKFMFNLYFFLT
jgi:hypothetical protein